MYFFLQCSKWIPTEFCANYVCFSFRTGSNHKLSSMLVSCHKRKCFVLQDFSLSLSLFIYSSSFTILFSQFFRRTQFRDKNKEALEKICWFYFSFLTKSNTEKYFSHFLFFLFLEQFCFLSLGPNFMKLANFEKTRVRSERGRENRKDDKKAK